MTASLEKQRDSVRRQTRSAKPADPSFYTVAWPMAPALAQTAAGFEPDCDPLPPAQIDEFVRKSAARDGFTPDLLRAIIGRESGFRPCAVSAKGAQGLMQLMPETAGALGVRDPFDPGENISAGARYLRQLLDRYGGDLTLALGAYNAGPARIDWFGGLPPFSETRNYVSSIIDRLDGRLR